MSTEIDISQIKTSTELHALIAERLCFPNYYGGNWDAFDECARDPKVSVPDFVRVVGLSRFEKELPDEAVLLRKCFQEASIQRPFQLEFEN